MKDRVVQFPNRYKLTPVSGDAYDLTPEPGIVTEPGTDISKANLLKDTTAALYGLGANAVPDEVFAAIGTKLPAIDKNFVNILRLKLQQSLKANDIDAWSDLLADASGINAAASSSYTLSGGKITALTLLQLTGDIDQAIGFGSMNAMAGQTFTVPANMTLGTVQMQLKKTGTPTDSVRVFLYATVGGLPTTLLATATNTIDASTLTTSYAWKTFNFSGVNLTSGTQYAFAVGRTGSSESTNMFSLNANTAGGYAGGNSVFFNQDTSTWGQWGSGRDACFIINATNAAVVWNAITPTEALSMAAVTADQTVGAGTITWYLSDDGANWTQITALDTMQFVNFNVASVRLKCVLTGNAEVRAVAWGGY